MSVWEYLKPSQTTIRRIRSSIKQFLTLGAWGDFILLGVEDEKRN